MVILKQISKSYHSSVGIVEALKDVSISVEKGDIVGIVGASGAGKSTLVRCINLLERPDRGQVIIDGQDLTAMAPKQLAAQRSRIGMIFQHFNLMAQRTVFKNVAYPLIHRGLSKAAIAEKVNNLLSLVGLADKANAYPAQLSGGQKQRVAIARALAGDPSVLLCDEATSALDPETTKSILRLIRDISQKLGLTVIMITHQKEVVQEICHKAVVLSGGVVVEEGPVLSLFTNPQTAAGKAFAGNLLEEEHVKEALAGLREAGQGHIYRLTFIGENSGEPFIAKAARDYGVLASILFGHIDHIQGETVGNLVVRIRGQEQDISRALRFLTENQVLVEEVAG